MDFQRMAEKLRVLELFSGIGGMHAALTTALGEEQVEVVAAVDINTTSNAVYQHNHPGTRVLNRNIAGLTAKEVGKMAPRVVLMSPPCQPHTRWDMNITSTVTITTVIVTTITTTTPCRQGKRLDTEDPRSSPLSHLAALLPSVPSITAILLENVAGFETSQARQEVGEVVVEVVGVVMWWPRWWGAWRAAGSSAGSSSSAPGVQVIQLN